MSVVNGNVFLNKIIYDAYNEGDKLENAIIDLYFCFCVLPEKILANKSYTDRYNRNLCKELGIKLAGKPPGRTPKNPPANDKFEMGRRNEVEDKFGTLETQ